MDEKLMKTLRKEQKNEMTGYLLYHRVAARTKDTHNAEVLRRIGDDEMEHYRYLKNLTGRDVGPARLRVFFFSFVSLLFGLTFGLKLLEKSETQGQKSYSGMLGQQSGLVSLFEQEEAHEQELLGLLDEERLNYIGSIVLGLNDALVELTGALAGFTFAFQNTRLIALTGLITGISASFSMAASEYLSSKQEKSSAEALKSSAYTGVTYIFTVLFLTLPYFLLSNPFLGLAVTLGIAVVIIGLFNYYVSVAKDERFGKRFFEMVGISLGVSAVSFLVGVLVKQVLGVQI